MTKRKQTERWWRCDECGKFFAWTDIADGRAVNRLIEPDSDLGTERWERLCRYHALPFFAQKQAAKRHERKRK